MNFVSYLLMFLLCVTALFLILLVLVQRGKGGGLAGAFGGMGGQSAFGTKAGDLFTKITIGVAVFWLILCLVSVRVLQVGGSGRLGDDLGSDQKTGFEGSADPGDEAPGDEGPAAE